MVWDFAVVEYSSFSERRSFAITGEIGEGEILRFKFFAVMDIPISREEGCEECVKDGGIGKDGEFSAIWMVFEIFGDRVFKCRDQQGAPSFMKHFKGDERAVFPLVSFLSFKGKSS